MMNQDINHEVEHEAEGEPNAHQQGNNAYIQLLNLLPPGVAVQNLLHVMAPQPLEIAQLINNAQLANQQQQADPEEEQDGLENQQYMAF